MDFPFSFSFDADVKEKKKTSKTGLQRPAARYDGIGKIGGGGYAAKLANFFF